MSRARAEADRRAAFRAALLDAVKNLEETLAYGHKRSEETAKLFTEDHDQRMARNAFMVGWAENMIANHARRVRVIIETFEPERKPKRGRR